jgi:hypothetical protein
MTLKKGIFLRMAAIVFTTAAIAAFAARGAEAAFNTDLVGQAAVTSFGEMVSALEFQPVADDAEGVWILSAPDGDAAFWWRKDAKDGGLSGEYICFNADPFINAGLDVSKLPMDMKMMFEERGNLMVGKKSSKKPEYDGDVTPVSSFGQVVKLDRESIGYHAALDHYGVTVADGYVFEWAKDMAKNDKDIVFVVDPKIFIDAGADPSKIEGWTYAKVPLEDARGRKFEAYKFLKPFDLR